MWHYQRAAISTGIPSIQSHLQQSCMFCLAHQLSRDQTNEDTELVCLVLMLGTRDKWHRDTAGPSFWSPNTLDADTRGTHIVC